MKHVKNGNNNIPRVMIAAAGSGSGKTVITCALLEILKNRGYSPISFKCGPDYIDPMFHRTVLGIDSHNLDMYLAGAEGVRDVFDRAVSGSGCDSSVIEGVMGIYDGMKPGSLDGSCYETAGITQTPIILIVDAAGVGQTVVSLIKGVLADDPMQLIKGVILNRMSDAFYEKIRPHLREELSEIRPDVAVLGHIPKSDEFALESRHLGLKLPAEVEDIREKIERIAKIVEKECDIDAVVKVMLSAQTDEHVSCSQPHDESTGSLQYRGVTISPETSSRALDGLTVAVARDEAFCFYYPENLAYLGQLGAKITYFSPIRDAKIPDGTDAILIGGGYPELYLEELQSNRSMLESVGTAIEKGIPSIAECGGFMYLHRMIEDAEGRQYAMAGVIDGICRYTGHLVNFGYTQIKEVREDLACDFREALVGMRGHEFHYYESTADGNDATLCKPSSGRTYKGMHIGSDRLWGWPHLWYPGLVK
ncbi:MAG: cobyrinate a,c-diamide synthase [Lachnospiraceae bacterium]|nr:cobyrinate a,c-diamide synthase [Lachnospiraceae bacterium]